jgi:hypothetical protein
VVGRAEESTRKELVLRGTFGEILF